ncbi:hypothetical protein IscW_ISCW015184 [Ixodes scapularis]|uniref:Uncharacterized protein n=1 Tax=Ixodes scapularis TaxID=6945 RepID=B7QP02_IXOSC|nr:hypothetical protein IscW_ISCW015184 [Ixodes scapularis]|eukprot:XP_002416657.1 hypothetical protein IscW_ISCW015184 [Ixodes scapularis]
MATACIPGSVGDQEAPWTRGRATNSIDVFSLPGLPVWGAPSTLKGNFENRDEDLSVASCVESLWSTKTVRAPSVLDPKDQGFHRAVMSKLGLQKQNNDYFQMFDPLQNVAGVEHKSTSMSGDVFESLSTEFPSRRQTAYSVALSPIPSDISLKVASPSFTSIGDNDSQSSARSFVTVTSDNDDEACALDLSNEGISSANLSGM